MDQLRNDSQRKAESTSAHRVALGQQQELEPESLEQQLKSNEACGYERGTIGVLSQAIEGARLRKWEISRECFNLVCGALQIPCDDGCNGSFQGKKFILVLYIKTDPFTNLTPCVHQHASTVTFAAICHRPVINNLGDAIMNHEAVVLLVPMREALSADNQLERHRRVLVNEHDEGTEHREWATCGRAKIHRAAGNDGHPTGERAVYECPTKPLQEHSGTSIHREH